MQERSVKQLIQSVRTSDGAGVKLRRSIGSGASTRLDPFLLLDEFSTDNPDDYIAGFPAHPHRGFETVTYMLDGHMLHEDHLGNRGDLKSGDVQWMRAGRGVIHSEMPQQKEGRMRGFQLWLNLPGREKMVPADYRDIASEEIPNLRLENGARVKVIAGTLSLDGQSVSGPINGGSTQPYYIDIELPPGASFSTPLPDGHNAFVYLVEGEASIAGQSVPAHNAAVLEQSGMASITAGESSARLLLLAATPLGEPVVQYGPFVMNTHEEIEQAIADYRNGTLTDAA